MDPPLATALLFRSDHMGDTAHTQPVLKVLTHPTGAHEHGAEQVQLRCLRAEWGKHFSAGRQEWPFPVVGRVNATPLPLTQAQRYTTGKLAGVDVATDLTPHLRPGVGADNVVAVQRSSSAAPTAPPAVYVLFAQLVVVKSEPVVVAEVQRRSAVTLRALVAEHRAAGARPPTVLDMCAAGVRRFLAGGGVAVDRLALNLRCPLSLQRIRVPVKDVAWPHVQCFDLRMYLAYARKTGRYECPVCNGRRLALPAALRVCPYFAEALRRFPGEDDVEVNSDASIHRMAPAAAVPPPSGGGGGVGGVGSGGGAIKAEGRRPGWVPPGAAAMVVDLTADSDAEGEGGDDAPRAPAAAAVGDVRAAAAADAPRPPGAAAAAAARVAAAAGGGGAAPPAPDGAALSSFTDAAGGASPAPPASAAAAAATAAAAAAAAAAGAPPLTLLDGLTDWRGVPYEEASMPRTGSWLLDAAADSEVEADA